MWRKEWAVVADVEMTARKALDIWPPSHSLYGRLSRDTHWSLRYKCPIFHKGPPLVSRWWIYLASYFIFNQIDIIVKPSDEHVIHEAHRWSSQMLHWSITLEVPSTSIKTHAIPLEASDLHEPSSRTFVNEFKVWVHVHNLFSSYPWRNSRKLVNCTFFNLDPTTLPSV